MRLLTLAPAKVNLVLRVGPLRPDGYHEILTLLAPLDLGDRVEVRVSRRAGPVTCRVPGLPELDGAANLAARAAEAFRARFGVRRGLFIRIEKRTPVVAGLGGGSSDAAAVLRCLAHAFPTPDRRALLEIALSVGSDVPFFLGPGPAWVAGRGERLRPADVPSLSLVLLFPRRRSLSIRAGEAYRWLDEARGHAATPPLGRPAPFRLSRMGNDLQAPCLARRQAIGGLLDLLGGAGAERALMSGSGPTVFGVFSGPSAARRAALTIGKEARRLKLSMFVVRTVRRQPRVTPWRSPRSASSRSTRRS
ncbi:MAG TPA: 4-(cytidine 5'-diphospho)-2-C-methyl-D-erythritol kinase [Anaeromyxobacter sp.]|nr:4-(cytidine 5'-diphospho)-2-C-methyl-D-erythritol kinase [Anaeromyxobacter sp.]